MNSAVNITINIDGNVFVAINELRTQFAKLSGSMQNMEDKVENAFGKIEKSAAEAQSSLRILAFDAMNRLAETFGQPFRSGIEAIYEYDKALRELSAITATSGQALQEMGASARQMASDFGGSAVDHLNTYLVLLSKLTPELAKSPQALNSMARTVAMLAKTMKGDTAGAVNAITAALNQYAVDLRNPTQAAKIARDMMNQMASAAQIGAVEIPRVAEALQQSGAAARAANVSFIETNAALQVLGKYGKEGAEGGVALRNVLGILNRQDFLPKEIVQRLQAAGIDVSALADKSLTLADRLEMLKSIANTNLLAGMFGTENQVAAQVLIENTELIRQFTREISMAGPVGEQMAATIMAGYKETHDRILQFFENIKIQAFGVVGGLLPFMDIIFTQLSGILQLSPGLLAMAEIFKKLGWATRLQALWTTILGGVTKVLTAIQWGLNAAFTASPIGWVVVAIGALVGALVYAWNKFEGFRKFLYGLWESFKAVFMNIGKLASGVLGGIGKMLVGYFTFDIDKIKEGFSQLQGALGDYGKSISSAFKEGEQKSLTKDNVRKTKKSTDTDTYPGAVSDTELYSQYSAYKDKPLVSTFESQNNQSTTSSGAGATVRNVNVKIENLVGKIEIVTQKLSESPGRIQEMVKDALVSAIRDTEVIIS